MSRLYLLLLAATVGVGYVGCAQCDTCDDFPAPCTGPNCGQNAGGIPSYLGPMMGQGTPVMGAATPNGRAMNDAAGPAPVAPPSTRSPETPPVDPTSPPAPMDTPVNPD